MADPGEEIELIARRRGLLEHLEQPREKPRIVETTDLSRSTVDRAIRELTGAELVERTDEGYATTVAGQQAAARHRQFYRDERTILDAGGVLSALPHDCDLPVGFVTDATTATGDGEYWLFDHVAELLRAADRYRAVLPRLADSRHLRLCRARAERGRLAATLLSTPSTLERIGERFPDLAAGLATAGSVAVGAVDSPGYGLLWFGRDGGPTTVEVVAYDATGVAGVVRNDDPAAVEWADRRLADLAADATPAFERVSAGGDDGHADASLPPTLRVQGFARVDATDDGWRVDVESEGRSTVIALRDRLGDGERVALLGPPDDRAPVCRAVAVRWDGTEPGTVLYRDRDAERPFEAVGALESVVGRDAGRTLVVVDGALEAGAGALFEVMRATSGRADVTFLLGADREGWSDPPLPTDARAAAFRREQIETVTLPGARGATTD